MQSTVKRVSRPSAQWSDEICIHNALTKVIGPQPPLAPFLAPGAPAAPAR